ALARAIHSGDGIRSTTGSMAIAASSPPVSSTARSSAATSSNGTERKSRCTPSGTPGCAEHQSCQPKYPLPPTTSRPVYVRATRTAALIASAPVFRNCTRSAQGTTLQNRSATSTSSTCDSPDTVPCATTSRTARVILGSPYPIATAPSAIVQSTSSLPSVVVMRQPDAWTKCVGPAGSAVP